MSATSSLRIQDITQAQAQATLDAVPFTTNAKGCRLAVKAPSHKNGYVKLKVRGRAARQEFYLQQLVAIAKGVRDLSDIGCHAGTHECSHLCHEVACFNPDHVVVEPAPVNKSRNKCVKLVCSCGQVVTNCNHEPACIL